MTISCPARLARVLSALCAGTLPQLPIPALGAALLFDPQPSMFTASALQRDRGEREGKGRARPGIGRDCRATRSGTGRAGQALRQPAGDQRVWFAGKTRLEQRPLTWWP